jgi:hypothetical protein
MLPINSFKEEMFLYLFTTTVSKSSLEVLIKKLEDEIIGLRAHHTFI